MSDTQDKAKEKKSSIRSFLMIGGVIVVVIVCAWFYLGSGRYIETDNAYIKATKTLITPEVSGMITAVYIDDNQAVKKGEILFEIDPAVYKIALDKALADLKNTYAQIETLKAQYRQRQADLARAKVEADFAVKEFDRRYKLIKSGAVSQSKLDDTLRERDTTVKTVNVLQEESNEILASLAGDADIDPMQHPLYQMALAAFHQAQLDLDHTKVIAPINGIIGTAPNIGEYARESVPLVNIVSSDNVWIEANYKETELTHVKIGQKVSIDVDTYPDHEWVGKVESISPATGSEFSILPAQNATGNWVKVVQRITVHISVDQQEDKEEFPLRTGMSTRVSIDTEAYPHAINWTF